ncbi:MAG: dTDP-glucose 4,6-dehydratase [Actinobacteria bacterium]|nr:dTDP-glucose 4,6-dehydratase [Actinomycetota bacterium]
MAKVLITGAAGFIGSHFTELILSRYDYSVIALDKLTYAGSLANLRTVMNHPRLKFVLGDICDQDLAGGLFEGGVDLVVNFAAESHVDRSIADAALFIQTNIGGTQVLLEAARKGGVRRFLQVSTDEVYGPALHGAFSEDAPLSPSSPYSASKAGADLLVLAYGRTYGLPVVITRSTNNYGPRQHPEKLIPKLITRAVAGMPLPLYGDGLQVRDWIHVDDNCAAIEVVLHQGADGQVYNVGTGRGMANLEVARRILGTLGRPEDQILFTADRPGHDRVYAVDTEKIERLGWKPARDFGSGLAETVRWYLER